MVRVMKVQEAERTVTCDEGVTKGERRRVGGEGTNGREQERGSREEVSECEVIREVFEGRRSQLRCLRGIERGIGC